MSSAILISISVISFLVVLVSSENVRCPDANYEENCVLRLGAAKTRIRPRRGSYWPISPSPTGLNYSNHGLTELILARRNAEKNIIHKPVGDGIESFEPESADNVDGIPYIDLFGVPSLILSHNNITVHELMYILHDQRTEDSNNTYILHYLDLGYLNISWLPENMFEFLTRVEVLRLNNNPIRYMENVMLSIKALENLQELDISGCGLQYLPFNMFQGLRISALNLNNNLLTSVPNLNYLSYTLRKLSIDNNPISFLDDTSFRTLYFIEEISAENCSIQGITGGTFSTNDNLRKLNLKNNSLHYLLPTDIPWRSSWISLENNPWDCSCRNLWLMKETYESRTNLVNPNLIRCRTPAVFKHWTLYDVFNVLLKQDECKEFFNEFVNLSGMLTPLPPPQQERQGQWFYEKPEMMTLFIIAVLLTVFVVVLRRKCIHSSRPYLVYNILQHQNRETLCDKNVTQHI